MVMTNTYISEGESEGVLCSGLHASYLDIKIKA